MSRLEEHHHHGHDHHEPCDYGRAFAFGVTLNLVFVAVEAGYGFLGNSVALLADAGHNLSDVLGLLVAWFAHVLARRPPGGRFTYGYRGASMLAALTNGVLLLVAAGALSWEAALRLAAPEPSAGKIVMAVAALGILINGVTARLFAAGSRHDANLRGAFLHMAADAVVSAGVVIAGVAILLTGSLWIDPVVSLAINGVIVWGTWGLLREAVALSLAAAPAHVDLGKVRAFLAARPGVDSVHDLHVWPMSTSEIALTCHMVMAAGHPGDTFLHELADELRHDFGIAHPTIQIETDPQAVCALAPADVV